MKSACRKTRVTDPAGIWDYNNLIGATVRICSSSVSNFNNIFSHDSSTLHTISDVYFRVSTDGKAITIIKLSDLPEGIFTWKDLEVLNLKTPGEAVCGFGCCGNIICGD